MIVIFVYMFYRATIDERKRAQQEEATRKAAAATVKPKADSASKKD
jgi:hypothetical protein